MARPRKPNAIKKAQGTYRKDRDTTVDAVSMPPGCPPMPDDLPAAAKRRWLEIVPELMKIETLAVVDGGSLEVYCRTFAQWQKLQELATAEPMVITFKGPAANPLAAEARKLAKDVLHPLEQALGLNFLARSKVKMPAKPKEEDPVEKELFGNQPPNLTAIAGGKTA